MTKSTPAATLIRAGRADDFGTTDPRAVAVIGSWWTVTDDEVADRAAEAALVAMPAAHGLLRFSTFRSLTGPHLFLLSQWRSINSRTDYLASAADAARGRVDDEVDDIKRDRCLAQCSGSLVLGSSMRTEVLVVARRVPAASTRERTTAASPQPLGLRSVMTVRADDGSELLELSEWGHVGGQYGPLLHAPYSQSFRWVGAVVPHR